MNRDLDEINDYMLDNAPNAYLYIVADEVGGGWTAHMQGRAGRELVSDMCITIWEALQDLDAKLGEGRQPS